MWDKVKAKNRRVREAAKKTAAELSDKTKKAIKKGVADLNDKVNGDKD